MYMAQTYFQAWWPDMSTMFLCVPYHNGVCKEVLHSHRVRSTRHLQRQRRGKNVSNIHPLEAAKTMGEKYAFRIEQLALSLYTAARDYAKERGIIIRCTIRLGKEDRQCGLRQQKRGIFNTFKGR